MRDTAERLVEIVEMAGPRLAAIGDADAERPALAGGWSRKQVVGHLIDSVVNNHQRFVRGALQGSIEWPSYDQNGCVRVENFQYARWSLLVETWTWMNRLLAHILASLPDEAEAIPCHIGHEGSSNLGELGRAYLEHLEHHLEQIGARAPSA